MKSAFKANNNHVTIKITDKEEYKIGKVTIISCKTNGVWKAYFENDPYNSIAGNSREESIGLLIMLVLESSAKVA